METQVDEPQFAAFRQSVMHRVGNLTLLTMPFNAELGRGPFKEKRPAIALQSQLQINAWFQRSFDQDRWTEAAITERGQHLAKQALRVWTV